MARMYDLRQKEVINTRDGCRFGFVSDLTLCTEKGILTAIIVPGPGRVLGVFGRDSEYCVPWDSITKIGEDIILVDCETEKVLVECDSVFR
jgi:YlmC/YmxH family sporulation protein